MIKNYRYVQRMGNKQSIALDLFGKIHGIINNPEDLVFVDLFGGGGSMSGMATNFFKKVIYNEINKAVADLFVKVQDNDFLDNLKSKWITREEFFEIKNKEEKTAEEEMILTTWSFGNNRMAYIYGKDVYRRKELTHKIIFCKTEQEYKQYIKQYNEEKVAHFEKYGAIWDCFLYDDDYFIFKNSLRRFYKFGASANYYRKFYKGFDLDLVIKDRGKSNNSKDNQLIKDLKEVNNELESLESLQSLERLESLERLQSLQSLEKIEVNNLDYRDVKLPNPNECIIYLDPPYRGTQEYESKFNFDELDNFVLSLKEKGYKIFISEYNFPFGEIIWSKTKRGFISQKKADHTGEEKLYFI